MDKYIEEPNIWNTWKTIYYEVKPILDALVNADAMSDYKWMGDQDAQSWDELSINNEADVRQGRYKAKLTFTDIVPMQEIDITFSINQANRSVSAEINVN